MGSDESRDEFVYDGFSEDSDDNSVSLHFGHWHQDVKNLIKKLFSDPSDCRLLNKKRSAYLWELAHPKGDYCVYFSKIDHRGWNFALEIVGPDEQILLDLESFVIGILRQIGAEISPRIGEEEEYQEIKSDYPKYFVY